MANIKITELQFALLEELSAADSDAIKGGEGIQAVGSTSGTGVGFSNGGSTTVTSTSTSDLTGELGAFKVTFGTTTEGSTSPT